MPPVSQPITPDDEAWGDARIGETRVASYGPKGVVKQYVWDGTQWCPFGSSMTVLSPRPGALTMARTDWMDPQPITNRNVSLYLEHVASLFGWRVTDVVLEHSEGEVPLTSPSRGDGISAFLLREPNTVRWQFEWQPRDEVLPQGMIACRPAVVLTGDERTRWIDFTQAVQQSVGAMHMQYAVRRDVHYSLRAADAGG